MIIRDVWEDAPQGFPSVTDLVSGLASDNPEIACRSIRDLRRMLIFFERTQLPLLMTVEGMTVAKASRTLGRSVLFVNSRVSGRPRSHPRRG